MLGYKLKTCFKSQKMPILGFAVLGSSWVFVGFLGMFFVFLEKTLS
jgi:hypothetical protein